MTRSARRHRSTLLLLVLVLVVAASLLAAGPAAASHKTVYGGSTTLSTDQRQTFHCLWPAGGVFLPIAPTTITPITAAMQLTFVNSTGWVDPAAHTANFSLRGGFQLISVQTMSDWSLFPFTSIAIKFGSTSTASALSIGPTRHPFAVLNLSSATWTQYWSGGHKYVRISNVKATMSTWMFNQLGIFLPNYMTTAPTKDLGVFKFACRIS
jgi:hypothetical protein